MGAKRRYGIVGAGAVGGYCAVKLQQAGFEVHCFLGHDYSAVKKNGLTLMEHDEIITVPVAAYNDISEMPPCDVILVTIKTTANKLLRNSLSRLLLPESVVILLQNGIGIEQEIAKFIEPSKIIGGTATLKIRKVARGVIKHIRSNKIELAQYYPDDKYSQISKSVEMLSQDFRSAGFDCVPFPHLPTIRWKKLADKIPSCGLSVILDATSKELIENYSGLALLKSITQEVIFAAKQCGAKLSDDFYESQLRQFESFKTMKKNYTLMKHDYDARKPLELHAIYENAIKIAKKHNVSMPLTEMLYHQLLFLVDKTNRKFP